MTDTTPRGHTRSVGLRHTLAIAILLAVTALFFSALFEGRTYSDVSRYQRTVFPWGNSGAPRLDDIFVHYDEAKSYYPWQAFMTDSYRGGEVPLWNPYSFAGTPFLAANANNALYPPRVALSRSSLSPTRVNDLFAAGHMFLAGVAMYLLLVYLRTSFGSALLGAVAWMASSFMLAWVALQHFVVVAALLPVAVLLADASIRRRSWPAALALGPVLALLFLGGNVLFVELCFAVVGACAAGLVVVEIVRAARARSLPADRRGIAGDLARLVVPWLLLGGLAAVSLLPTAELVGSMRRTPLTYSELQGWALPWIELRRFLVPPSSAYDESTHHDAYHTALFCGTVVALLAIVGLGARRPGAWFARALVAVTLLVALATPVLALPYFLLPGFDNFKPLGRVLFLAGFAIAILAAFGLDIVFRTLERPFGGRAVATVAVGGAAIALTVAQLRAYSPGVMHDQEPTAEATYPQTPLVERVRRDESARVLPVGAMLPGSTPLVYPLRSAVGYESIVPGRVQDFWRVVAGLPADRLTDPLLYAFEPGPRFGSLRSDLLWRAGVRYVAAPPAGTEEQPTPQDVARLEPLYDGADGRLFAVRDALPRAYFVAGCVVAADSRSALVRFQRSGFDPRRAVILERGEVADAASCSGARAPSGDGSARIVEQRVNSITVDVDAPSSGFVVLNDTWDEGWHANVDGAETDVLPANALFRAVRVEAGRQTIEFRYRPRSYEIGRALSAGTLVVVLVLFGVLALRRRVRAASQPDRESVHAT